MRFLSAILACCLSAAAAADECEALPPSSVTLRRLDFVVTVNTDYDYKSITVLSTTEHRTDKRVLGLTRGTARVGLRLGGPLLVDRSRRWECASPAIEVVYGFSPMTVYIAKEFPKGSCAYNEIYQHEMRHVNTYRQHLAAIENEIRERLTQRFAGNAPSRAAVGETQARLGREFDERWLPYIEREIAQVKSAQALIDTPEEYRRVSESCNGEILRVIRP